MFQVHVLVFCYGGLYGRCRLFKRKKKGPVICHSTQPHRHAFTYFICISGRKPEPPFCELTNYSTCSVSSSIPRSKEVMRRNLIILDRFLRTHTNQYAIYMMAGVTFPLDAQTMLLFPTRGLPRLRIR